MNNNNDLLVFDEDEAVKYILNLIPKHLKSRITEDDIDYVLDIMYDYYEKEGFIEEDSAEEANIDEEAMFNYIMKCVKKEDACDLNDDEVRIILEGEFAYGKSIGVYKDVD